MNTVAQGRRVSTDLQDFVFDGRLPAKIQDTLENNSLRLKDDTTMTIPQIASYVSGIMLGCKHEFRVGSHDTYSVHLDTLRDRTVVFEFIRDNFGVARPKDPLVAMGKFTKYADLDRVLRYATVGHKSRIICCEFWEILSGYDSRNHPEAERDDISGFYSEWISNVRKFLQNNNLYVHESFLAGFLHCRHGSMNVTEMNFSAAMKADRLAKSVPDSKRMRLIEADSFSELYDVRDISTGETSTYGLFGPKVGFVTGQTVFVMNLNDVRRVGNVITIDDIKRLEADEFRIPGCLKTPMDESEKSPRVVNTDGLAGINASGEATSTQKT